MTTAATLMTVPGAALFLALGAALTWSQPEVAPIGFLPLLLGALWLSVTCLAFLGCAAGLVECVNTNTWRGGAALCAGINAALLLANLVLMLWPR